MNIVSIGMCTPLGLCWKTSVAEMQAGTLRFVETQIELGPDEYLRACRLPLLSPHLDRTERTIGLAVTALMDALASAETLLCGVSHLPMLLALPGNDAGDKIDARYVASVLQAEAEETLRIKLTDVGIIQEGRAGFLMAIERAEKMLRAGSAPWILAGASDSLCDLTSLSQLLRSGRILSNDNIDGLLPGEGAAFVLLTRLESPSTASRVHGRIVASATGREPHPFLSRDMPSRADGLTSALTQLRARLERNAVVDAALSCQPGETFWARELTQAYLRNADFFPEPFKVTAVSESLGDVGAASGAILTAYALSSAVNLAAPCRTLIYGGSDTGEVGSCVIEARIS